MGRARDATRNSSLCSAAAAICVATFVSATSHAEERSQAELLFRDARELMKAGAYGAARDKLSASQSLDPSLGTLLNLAICDEHLGRAATAWKEYREVLDSIPSTDPRADFARRNLEALSPTVPRIRFTTTNGVAGILVELDGEPLRVNSGIDLFVDPGAHRVVVVAARGHVSERRFQIELGQVVAVPVSLPPTDDVPNAAVPGKPAPVVPLRSVPAPRAAAGAKTPPLRIGAYVAGGVGAAGFIAAGIFTGLALGQKSTVEAHCSAGTCDLEGIRATDSGAQWLRLADIGLVVGVAGLVSGGLLLWQSSQRSVSVEPVTGGASLRYNVALP